MSITHIAGPDIRVGNLLRQRCAWCGALLLDYDLELVAVPEGEDPTPATWPVGELISVEGVASWLIAHVDGDALPSDACAQLDPAVTR